MAKKQSTKPTITKREASRLVAEAGAEAYSKNGSQVGDPKHIDALVNAGEVFDFAGFTLRPVTPVIFLALEELWNHEIRKSAVPVMQRLQVIYTFVHPTQARKLMQRTAADFNAAVDAFAECFNVEAFKRLEDIVDKLVREFYGVEDDAPEAGKKKRLRPSKTGQVP